MNIYEKNYEGRSLTIPASIWNDKTIYGLQKIVLTLVKRFTNDGKKPCEALTGLMSGLVHTTEKAIKDNLEKLHKAGHIEIYKDEASRTKYSIRYTYVGGKPSAPAAPSTSQLF